MDGLQDPHRLVAEFERFLDDGGVDDAVADGPERGVVLVEAEEQMVQLAAERFDQLAGLFLSVLRIGDHRLDRVDRVFAFEQSRIGAAVS